MKKLIFPVVAIGALLCAGCNSGAGADPTVNAAPAGQTGENNMKGGASKAQGRSSKDLGVPDNAGGYQAGSKMGGG